MTPANDRQMLRRLRFPAPHEMAFRARYFEKVVPSIRVGLGIGTAMAFFFALRSLFVPPVLLVSNGSVGLALLVLLLLTYVPVAYRLWLHTAVALAGSVAALNLFNIANSITRNPLITTPTHRTDNLILNALLFLVGGFVILRPRVSTFLWYILIVVSPVFLSGIGNMHIQMDTLNDRIGIFLLPIVGLLLVATYHQEFAQRAEFWANHLLQLEQDKSESLLHNILPVPVATRLKESTDTIADTYPEVGVLFADLVDFTPLSATLSAEEIVNLLNQIFSTFDTLAEKHGLEKIKTIGDAYMVAVGVPEKHPLGLQALADMALDMQAAIPAFQARNGNTVQLRIGMNAGPVVAGVIGTKKFIYDLWGDTVNLASRMESQGIPGEIQVTEEFHDKLRDTFAFEKLPRIHVKGRGECTVYRLLGRR